MTLHTFGKGFDCAEDSKVICELPFPSSGGSKTRPYSQNAVVIEGRADTYDEDVCESFCLLFKTFQTL
jgi:hypothetical protein